MELETIPTLTRPRLHVKISHQDKSPATFEQDVLAGLSSDPKWLMPKYFYDRIGSQLFEKICEQPEYYPTRTEYAILQEYSYKIGAEFKDDIVLIELGSGSSTKTRLLLETFLASQGDLHYVPIDISKNILVDSANTLLKNYDGLNVTAVVSDYITALKSLREKSDEQKLIIFLGSSIGNFDTEEREDFLLETRAAMNDQDRLLLGLDLLKDKGILESAYNDSHGVTAKFNLNMLTRINRELNGEFDPDFFNHKAFLNEEEHRIEMHLESTAGQSVRIGQIRRTFSFAKGETIHTENSHKFSQEDIEEMVDQSGFALQRQWYDQQRWFSLNLLQPV